MDNLTQSEQATPAASDLTSLPPEILRRIVVNHLSIRDRFRAAAVCRTLRMMLDDLTAWADVEKIYISVCHDKHYVFVYGVDGDNLGTWFLTSSSIPELLKRSRPKQLDLVEEFPSVIPSLIHDMLPFPSSTLEYVRLWVDWFEDDYLPLFQRLAPSLKGLGIIARKFDQSILDSPADFTELESLVIEGNWKPGELQRGRDAISLVFLQRLPNLRVLSLMPTLSFEDSPSSSFEDSPSSFEDSPSSFEDSEHDVYEFYRGLANALNNRITPVAELCMDVDFAPHIMSGMSCEARRAIETLCVPTLPLRLPREALEAGGYLYGQELVSALPSRLPGLRRLSVWRLPTCDVATLREAFFAEHNASTDTDRQLTIELRGADGDTTHETRGRVTVTVVNIGRRLCAHNINTLINTHVDW